MNGLQVKFENKEFPTEVLDRFLFALSGRMNELFDGGVEQPVTSERAWEYLGVSKDTFYRLVKAGTIKAHFIPGLSTPFYLRSEIYQLIKKS